MSDLPYGVGISCQEHENNCCKDWCKSCQAGDVAFDEFIARGNWSTSPPTKPGWYWARIKGDADRVLGAPIVVRVRTRMKAFDTLIAEHAGLDEEFASEMDEFDLWSGPIEPPKMTEGK